MLIGGFFSVDGALLLDESPGREFMLRLDTKGHYKEKIFTSNGRTASVLALQHCAKRMEGKKILLPDYLCLSVISAVEAAGLAYDFYHVQENLEINWESLYSKIDESTGMIYVIHYFSVPQHSNLVEQIKSVVKEKNILIMEDITQALFSKHSERMGFGDYIVASLRKWFPMTDGGLLAIRNGLEGEALTLADAYEQSVYQELLISVLRMQYERDPNQSKEAYLHYEKAANASRYLDLTPRSMTAASQHILTHADIRELIQRRVDNFNFLEEKLKAIPEIKVLSKPIGTDGNFVPFGMTILVEKREELYQYLTAHNVIPEIQWILPAEYYEPGQDAVFLSKHNLMLQCDQRYAREDMDYVENLLSAFFHHAPDLDQ